LTPFPNIELTILEYQPENDLNELPGREMGGLWYDK
jgi:hypothetical protein